MGGQSVHYFIKLRLIYLAGAIRGPGRRAGPSSRVTEWRGDCACVTADLGCGMRRFKGADRSTV
jgi:hypothetical protein